MEQSAFRVVAEDSHALFVAESRGHEFRVFLVETPSGRGFDITPDWIGSRPPNHMELLQAVRTFAREHTMWG